MSVVIMSVAKPLSSRQTAPAIPRLGVIHLLLWMLGCSGTLTGYRIFTEWDQVQPENVGYVRFLHLGAGMAYGVGLVTLYLWGRSFWLRDRVFPSQPGHWLLVLGVAAALLDGGAWLTTQSLVAWNDLPPWQTWYAHQTIGWGLGVFVTIAILAKARAEARWRILFASFVVVAVARFAGCLALWWSYTRGGFLFFSWNHNAHVHATLIVFNFVVLSALTMWDLLGSCLRDWAHWTGVSVWVGLGTLALGEYAWFWLTP